MTSFPDMTPDQEKSLNDDVRRTMVALCERNDLPASYAVFLIDHRYKINSYTTLPPEHFHGFILSLLKPPTGGIG